MNMLTERINRLLDLNVAEEEPRDYLGASVAGQECLRFLSYVLLGTKKNKKKTAQLERIFDFGHFFEDYIYKKLEVCGFKFSSASFSEFSEKFKGHVDRVVTYVPDNLFKVPCVSECKTMNNRNFNILKKKGVKTGFPKYYTQILIYQKMTNFLNECFFISVNKDTSEIYTELIKFNAEVAEEKIERVVRVIKNSEINYIFPKISDDMDNFNCKFCDFQENCHKKGENENEFY